MKAAIELVGGRAVVVKDRTEKMILAFTLQGPREDLATLAGQEVNYRELWDDGWEGDGANVTLPDGRSIRGHLEIYAAGNTISEIANNLNMDEDDVALGLVK